MLVPGGRLHPDGACFGELNAMENTTVFDSALPIPNIPQKTSKGSRSTAAKSHRRSRRSSAPGRAKVATTSPASLQIGLDGALSLLQVVFDQALEVGLKAKIRQMPQGETSQMPQPESQSTQGVPLGHLAPTSPPVLVLELHGVSKCPNCQAWFCQSQNENQCPVC
jgi:hypothetical protein